MRSQSLNSEVLLVNRELAKACFCAVYQKDDSKRFANCFPLPLGGRFWIQVKTGCHGVHPQSMYVAPKTCIPDSDDLKVNV